MESVFATNRNRTAFFLVQLGSNLEAVFTYFDYLEAFAHIIVH